jgi:hypothetical protein
MVSPAFDSSPFYLTRPFRTSRQRGWVRTVESVNSCPAPRRRLTVDRFLTRRQSSPGRETLSILNSANSFYLCYLSKPAADRTIYRAIQGGSQRKIVELGVGTGCRALRMIDAAASQASRSEIQYTGLDPFEARSDSDGPGLSLKAAYRTFRATGARIQLVPGDPLAQLVHIANSLGKIDLLIFSAGLDMSFQRAWWFVPRLLHEQTRVCVEQRSADGVTRIQWKTPAEIEQLASAAAIRRAA